MLTIKTLDVADAVAARRWDDYVMTCPAATFFHRAGWQPIMYAGLVSVGVAYTLQVVGQKSANPAHAAIILSLESVFAAIGGVWLLDETLSLRAWCGCGLMMAGMLLSQVRWPSATLAAPQPT